MARDNRTQRQKQKEFLDAYARLGTITHAAEAAHVDRLTHHNVWMKDAEYRAQFAAARRALVEMLEREAIRRAAEGTDKPVFWKGEQIGAIREYSDTLLIFMLKANDRDKYTDNVRLKIESSDEDLRRACEAAGLDPEVVLREVEAILGEAKA